MSDSAFIVSRSIFDNGLWKNQLKFRLFFFLFGNALYSTEGKEYGNIKLERGQYLRSFRNLQDDLEYIENNGIKNYSLSQIKRTVDELIKEERITIEHTQLGTLFTIVNYQQYQDLSSYKNKSLEQHRNTYGTGEEQGKNNTIKDKKDIKDIKDKEDIICGEIVDFVSEVLDYLNEKLGTHYKATTESIKKLINTRKKEGFTIEDFKKVIDNKTSDWLNDPKMNQYLRPITLFGTKFESYLNVVSPKKRPTIGDWAKEQGVKSEI